MECLAWLAFAALAIIVAPMIGEAWRRQQRRWMLKQGLLEPDEITDRPSTQPDEENDE